MSADTDLLKELHNELKDVRRKALLDAYLAQPDVQSIVNRALELLAEATDEIHKP